MRTIAYTLCLAFAISVAAGCGGKKEVATQTGQKQNAGVKESKETTKKQMPVQQYDKKGRPIPSIGGPGGMSTAPATANNNNSNSGTKSSSENSSASSGTFSAEGSLANGLFPQAGAGVYTSVYNSTGVGGGLFPQRGTGETSTASANTGQSRDRNGNIRPSVNGGTAGSTAGSDLLDETETVEASEYGEVFDMAAAAFKVGDGNEAFNYLYGYMLSSDDALDQFPLQWHRKIKRPRVAMRWGVGVTINQPDDMEDKYPVIGDDAEESSSSTVDDAPAMGGAQNRGPAGGNSSSVYAKVDTNSASGLLLYYTGDFGDKLVQRFVERRGHGGYFGKVLKEMPEVGPEPKAAAEEQQTKAPPRIGSNKKKFVMPSVGAPSGGSAPEDGQAQGGPAGSRNSGDSSTTEKSSGNTLLSRWTTGDSAGIPEADLIGELTPGVLCLGVGSREELGRRAVENKVDALLVVQVKVTERKGVTTSSTSLRLVDVETGDILETTSGLKYDEVAKKRARGRGDDPVDVQLDKIFADVADVELRAEPMISLNNDQVAKRVAKLQSESDYPLRDAVEVVHYYREGLLSEEDAISALDEMLSGNGDKILNGSERERRQLMIDMAERASRGSIR